MAHCKNDQLTIMGLVDQAPPEILPLFVCVIKPLNPLLGTDSTHETVRYD